ncbi:MAG: hypothetical protein KUF77_09695 [Candidatus Thiodiazotropha sp. (ex Lucina aurantia)]|nr:hypothetical protein [Candidatus Thiodiazotropha taylori]MBV2097845.1 hypothetical protein [Candidatus Thiodiazotropha sp. (ex Codakia orbicularis)]MBV2103282.1 hypothetical protein [Candidatus Thiodiazotropha sp. (ex Lucina aurantia)]MBV2116355.1 hypothetical protein [Candidatus Thiodiazotropha sp. (ex Lucina aurantia)]
MMNIIKVLSACLLLAACSEQAAPPEPQSTAIFTLIENGGSVAQEDQEHALNTALHLFQNITTLARRKATRDAQVHIILTATPNKVAWSGTPAQLLAQAGEVKNLIAFKPSFSDLVMAYEQIETTINLTQPDDVRLYAVGPFIHVPFQNGNDPIDITLPQAVPSTLALSRFIDRLSVLKFLNVHDDQDQVLFSYLTTIGLNSLVGNRHLTFALKGVAQTKSSLADLL